MYRGFIDTPVLNHFPILVDGASTPKSTTRILFLQCKAVGPLAAATFACLQQLSGMIVAREAASGAAHRAPIPFNSAGTISQVVRVWCNMSNLCKQHQQQHTACMHRWLLHAEAYPLHPGLTTGVIIPAVFIKSKPFG